MSEKETEEEAVVVQPVDEAEAPAPTLPEGLDKWQPKTSIGKKVKEREIVNVDEILDNGRRIMEFQIVDMLLPNIESDLLHIGQSKGKFGGGSRRVFKQTQKKTKEGNKPHFATLTVVGNRDGYVGIGYGKAKETVPAREKSLRKAKTNLFKIARGSGSWEDKTTEPHTIPFKVTGKCGSCKITLLPAPKGKGLCVEKECAKILALAGIQNVWSKTEGQTKNKINLIYACERALRKLVTTKVRSVDAQNVSMMLGKREQA
ncbi:MAG: 30S ribosomal protein S5 [archaeon]